MPKTAISDSNKVTSFVRQYPDEFAATPKTELYCKLCETIVKHEKTFFVDSHRRSAKHSSKLSSSTTSARQQQFMNPRATNLAEDVARAFLSADIPLNKLQHPAIRLLFTKMGYSCPSMSSCRLHIPQLFDEERRRVKDYVSNQQIFLIADESDIKGQKYFNILVGKLEAPTVSYMIDCVHLTESINSKIVCRLVDDVIQFLGTQRSDFVLLLSDAARYMTSAGLTLKILFPQLFHVTCVAHLLHNCAMHVAAKFPSIDNVIATVKACTVKNKSRRLLFSDIGQPPHPVLTRWGSWLEAAFWYADNLPAVRNIFEAMEGKGLLLSKAKEALSKTELTQELVEILQYRKLVELVHRSESSSYTIAQAMNDVQEIEFEEDPCEIKAYIQKRLVNNDIQQITDMTRSDISPSVFKLLLNAQPTSAAVERSFSMLKNVLKDNRNFSFENVRQFATINFNSSV